ncbi:MAG: hypothetical protein Q7S64_03145 [bacterium]|nr:hypothetical protein [bacterium]
MRKTPSWSLVLYVIAAAIVGYIIVSELFRGDVVIGGEIKSSYDIGSWLKVWRHAWATNASLGYSTHSIYINPGLPDIFTYSFPLFLPFFGFIALLQQVFGRYGFGIFYVGTIIVQYLAILRLLPVFGFRKNLYLLSFVAASYFVLVPYKAVSYMFVGIVYSLEQGLILLLISTLYYFTKALSDGNKLTIKYYHYQLILLYSLLFTAGIGTLVIVSYGTIIYFIVTIIKFKKQGNTIVLKKLFKITALTIMWLLLLMAYVLFPLKLNHNIGNEATESINTSYPMTNKWKDIITGSPSMSAGEITIVPLVLVIILAWFGLFWGKIRYKKILIITALAAGVFAVGTGVPFAKINYYFFQHLPLMNFNRSVTRYEIFVVLAYAIGLAAILEILCKQKPKKFIFALSMILLFIWACPVILRGNANERIKAIDVPTKYFKLNDWLKENYSSRTRVIYLPQNQDIATGYDWSPQIKTGSIYKTPYDSMLRLNGENVTINSTFGLISQYLRYAMGVLNTNQVEGLNMLKNTGAELFIVDSSVLDKDIVKKINDAIRDDKDFIKIDSAPVGYEIYKNLKLFKAVSNENGILLVGDLNFYKTYQNKPVVMLNQQENDPLDILKKCITCNLIIQNNYTIDDLLGRVFSDQYEIKPILKRKILPEEIGWSALGSIKSLTSESGILTQTGSVIVTNVPDTISYSLEDKIKDNQSYYVFVKYVQAFNRWGKGKVAMNEQTLIELDSNKKDSPVINNWHIVGPINITTTDSSFKIEETDKGSLTIEKVLLVPSDAFLTTKVEVERYVNQLQKQSSNIQSSFIKEFNDSSNTEVIMSGLSKGIVNMQMQYDRDWIPSTGKLIAGNYYGLATINDATDNTIRWSYRTEKFYHVGLIVTLSSLLILVYLSVVSHLKYAKADENHS